MSKLVVLELLVFITLFISPEKRLHTPKANQNVIAINWEKVNERGVVDMKIRFVKNTSTAFEEESCILVLHFKEN